MAALPYMPLYIADYLADAAHLSTIEHGAYLLLIMTYWQRGEPLPSDDKKLSRIVRMTPDEWADARETLAEFFHDDGTTWTHKRINAELERVADKSEKARNARAQRTKNETNQDVKRTNNGRTTDVKRTNYHTDTDTDTDTSKKEKTPARKRAGYDQDFEDWWRVYPHKVGKDAAAKAYRKALTRTDSPTLFAKAQAFAAEQTGKDPQYIAHPSTWLNQGRWMDEPAGRSPPDSPETDRPRAGGNPPWAKWRAHLTFTQQIDTLKEFKQFQEAHGFDAANQRAIADAKQAGVPL